MSKGNVDFDSASVEYYTPKKLVEFFGKFDYDPATTPERAAYHSIPHFTSLPDNGLEKDWTVYRRIWINPPFSDKHHFWWKACQTYKLAHNEIFFLCPIEFLTTSRFYQPDQPITLYLPEGRVKFEHTATGGGVAKSPAFGSVIISPSPNNSIIKVPKEYCR